MSKPWPVSKFLVCGRPRWRVDTISEPVFWDTEDGAHRYAAMPALIAACRAVVASRVANQGVSDDAQDAVQLCVDALKAAREHP